MFCIENNEKNKSAVILNPERSEWVSRSHVTSVESVVNDRAKTKCYSAKRDLYGDFAYAQPLKMTRKTLSFLRLRGASGAQGISAPASCREAHKRRFILNPWLLRFVCTPLRMTISVLALLFTLATTAESWAATSGCDCGSTANGGSASDCCWKIEDGVLTIYPNPDRSSTGNVTMKNFWFNKSDNNASNGYTSKYSSTAPWARQGATSVVIENGISNIGQYAFRGDTKITSVTGMENVNRIENQAFSYTTSLQSIDTPKVTSIGEYAFSDSKLQSVDMPNVETIGNSAFQYATSLQSIDMPKVTSIGVGAFQNASLLKYAGLNPNISSDNIGVVAFSGTKVEGCGTGDNYSKCNYCTNSYVSGNSASSNISNGTTIYQPSATGNTGSCVATCADGYTASNGLCKKNPTQVAQNTTPQVDSGNTGGASTGGDISGDFNPADCYNNGQVPYDNKCWDEYPFAKKHWTPAEASKWLHDGNDNFVVITFKK